MTGQHGTCKGRRPLAIALAIAAVAAASPCHAVRIDYTIDAGVEHNDNVALDDTREVRQNLFRAGLGFTVSEEGSRMLAEVTGRVEHYGYPEIFADRTEGTLDARAQWTLIPNRLTFNVDDDLSVQPIDAFVPDAPGNRQQVNILSAGPSLLFGRGREFYGTVDLRHIRSDADETDEFNSDRVHVAATVSRDLNATSQASLTAQRQQVRFDGDWLQDYDRGDAYLTYARHRGRIGLVVDAGYSWLTYDDGRDRSGPLLRTEATYRPNDRSHFALRAWRQYSDAATQRLDARTPGGAPPGRVPIGSMVIRGSQYREDRIALEYTYNGVHNTVTAEPFHYRARYIEDGEFDQDGRGIRLGLSRRLSRTLSLSAWTEWEHVEYRRFYREVRMLHAGLSLRKNWTRHWQGRLDWTFYRHDTEPSDRMVDRNTVYLAIVYSSY